MATIIGLHSGKEIVVQDNAYALYQSDNLVHIFISEDDNRLITIKHDDIEFIDEPKTVKRIERLNTLASQGIPEQSVGVDYV